MAATIHDPERLAGLYARLDRLTAEAQPRWGRMNVGQMLCHLVDSMRMGLGELPVRSSNKKVFQVFPLKHLILYVLPFPKGAPTARELLSTEPGALEADRAELRRLVDRIVANGPAGDGPAHPLFGPCTNEEWGVLAHKHMDHHFKQFGV